MRIQVGFSRIINLNVPDFIFMMRQKLFNENFKLIFIVIDTAEMWPPLLSVRLSREVRGELHKRKSPACRLNTNCFRVALARLGHPKSRDLTFQYLKLVQIFTPTECTDILLSPVTTPSPFHVDIVPHGCYIVKNLWVKQISVCGERYIYSHSYLSQVSVFY